jgi:hypothetical protein
MSVKKSSTQSRPPKLFDLSKKQYRQFEQMVLAQESEKIKNTPAKQIKQAVLNILDRFPMLIYNVSAELEKMQG